MSENVSDSGTVRLRDVEDADVELFFEQQHDPEAVRRSKFTPRDKQAFMTHWATRVLGDPTVFVQTVTVDGEPAGNIVAWWEQDNRFIGYWFGRSYWGRGIGTKALTLFLRREPARPLYAAFSGNAGSVRLLERCGFQRTGTVWHGENEHIMLILAAGEPAGREIPRPATPTSDRRPQRPGSGSRGSPRMRSAMTLRLTSVVPPPIDIARQASA
ncbi:MAG: GNAT family N-acetyltransferase [Actinomadura sp.]